MFSVGDGDEDPAFGVKVTAEGERREKKVGG